MARQSVGRRLAIGGVVLALVLGGLLVTADRVGAWIAERTIADQLRQEISARGVTTDQPEVSVGGFPFLTQVLSGDYDSISIALRNVEGGGIRLPELDVSAVGVTADLNTVRTGQGDIIADRVTGTATVGYATIAALTNQPSLSLFEQGGKLRVRLPVELMGAQITLVGTADVKIDKDEISVAVQDLTGEAGELPPTVDDLVQEYADQLSVSFNLPDLPFNLTLGEVVPRSDGLVITASASGVPLTG